MLPCLTIREGFVADIRYQVLVNGRVVCTSGIEGLGVLTAILTWLKRKRRADDQVAGTDEVLESHYLKVGGLISGTDEHLHWCEEPLKEGDEIVIRILGPGAADKPAETYKFPE
jgi:hypothetical protein